MEKETLTLSYGQILAVISVLSTLLDKPLASTRGADAIQLARLYKALLNENTTFHEQHTALIKKHGGVEVEVEGKVELTVPPKNIAAFQPEFQEMAEVEIALPFGKLPTSTLDNAGLSLADTMIIEVLFDQ